MVKNKKSQILRNKRAVVLLFVALAIGVSLVLFNIEKPKDAQLDGVNLSPPTEEERISGDEKKNQIINDEQSRPSTPLENGEKYAANVIITDVGVYDDVVEVRAFINNHYENGTCKITLSQDSKTIVKETPAYIDVSTTICTNPLINKTQLEKKGEWQVVVEYTSKSAYGKSTSKTLRID